LIRFRLPDMLLSFLLFFSYWGCDLHAVVIWALAGVQYSSAKADQTIQVLFTYTVTQRAPRGSSNWLGRGPAKGVYSHAVPPRRLLQPVLYSLLLLPPAATPPLPRCGQPPPPSLRRLLRALVAC
jgi:hypothetical protein